MYTPHISINMTENYSSNGKDFRKQSPNLWVLKRDSFRTVGLEKFVITEGKAASSLALSQISSTSTLCFEWGPIWWRWWVMVVTCVLLLSTDMERKLPSNGN